MPLFLRLMLTQTQSTEPHPSPLKATNPHRKRKQPDPEQTTGRKTGGERAAKKDCRRDAFHILDSKTDQNNHAVERNTKTSPIEHWVREGNWPRNYVEGGNNEMYYPYSRKKPTRSLPRQYSESTISTASDQKPRETKSVAYRDARYDILLASKGSYLDKADCGITEASKNLYMMLLEKDQPTPKETLFSDEFFDQTCRKLEGRNEARVILDINRLIVPSAEALATRGATHLNQLIENVNEGWNNCDPFTDPRPQPDYSVGFKPSAFTETQLQKLGPLLGDLDELSHFKATYRCFFPFLSCEVKCGTGALDVADRQNAHSMTLAVRGVVSLFRILERDQELNQEILAFSISHDHTSVRIYGHYPVIEGKKVTYYRHPIDRFDFTGRDGRERWTAYKFTKNIYDSWMPNHFKRLCSVVNELPDRPPSEFENELSQPSESQVGLSQDTGGTSSRQGASQSVGDDDSQPSEAASQQVTPYTSYTQKPEPAFKKRGKGREHRKTRFKTGPYDTARLSGDRGP